MTLPPAALPGHHFPTAPTEFVPHPGADHVLGCPTCGETERLVGTYTVRTTVQIAATEVPATSRPEVEPLSTPSVAEPGNYQQPVKIACGACQWSYEGPNPLGKLVSA